MAETEKAALRTQLGAARRARSAVELAAARDAICGHVLALVAVHGWDCVAAYEPRRTEPGSVQLLAALHERGVQVLVPSLLDDRDLAWRWWTPRATDTGPLLGQHAVATAGLVVVPALAVARDGTRLGRGGGSYDRALARRAPTSLVAALVFATELHDVLPADPWDQPVDAVITPDGVQRLRGNTAVAPAG